MKPFIAWMLAFAVAGNVAAVRADASKPNILIIVSDDQGWADAGFQGSKEAKTPHLDAIAKSGVRCTNGYSSHPFCAPSRAGLLTGRYQSRFGFEYNPPLVNERIGVPLTERLLPQFLKQAGYRTGWIGKWHLGAFPRFQPSNRGFDETFGFLGGGHQFSDWKPDKREYYSKLVRAGKETEEIPPHLTTAFGAEAVSFVRKKDASPWMLYLAFNAPHGPNQPTAESEAKFADIAKPGRRKNLAQVSMMDDAIGAVMAALKETGQAENTIVFFISDNGGQTYYGAINTPLREKKGTLYEGGVRVPFVVSWPKGLPQGATYDEPVIALDIFATSLAVAEVALPQDAKIDGVNLIPHLSAKSKTPPHERLFWRTREAGQLSHAMREGRWKAVRHEGKPVELYDLMADIGETKDLAMKETEIANRLNAALDAWDKELTPSMYTGRVPPAK